MIKLFGFTLLRNGVKFDYSFRESFHSLCKLSINTYIALDPGEDDSLREVEKIKGMQIIPSNWDMSLKKGLVLSVETNKALEALRADHGCDDSAWGIYLQADEVLHAEDFDILKRDLELASQSGCDALSFRYLHFWQTHNHIAISKRWYPHEIRAIKLNSPIESWGDAQGFRNYKKIYYTEARIFHYGHVREASSYTEKMRAMGKLYHEESEQEKRFEKGLKSSKKNKCTLYFGTHPPEMKERILRMGDVWELPEKNEIAIVGNKEKYSAKLLSNINAKKIHWYESLKDVPNEFKNEAIILEPNFFERVFKNKKKCLTKMDSPLAQEWTPDFKLVMALSSYKVGFKSGDFST